MKQFFIPLLLPVFCATSLNADVSAPEQQFLSQNIEKAKWKALMAMDELEGWCTKHKATVLMDLIAAVHPKVIVEVGVWGGKSLIPMAFAVKKVSNGMAYGIDPWSSVESAKEMEGVNKDWWSKVDHEAIYQGLVEKISKFKLGNSITLIRKTSEKADPIENIDILHIDGNHSEKTSFYDVTKWAPLVRSGGFIVFDDITWGTTTRAVDWLNNHCEKVMEYREDSVWGIWRKP